MYGSVVYTPIVKLHDYYNTTCMYIPVQAGSSLLHTPFLRQVLTSLPINSNPLLHVYVVTLFTERSVQKTLPLSGSRGVGHMTAEINEKH